jgi:hypothetical protein
MNLSGIHVWVRRKENMDRNHILELIGEEISRLEQVKELLTSTNGHNKIYANISHSANGRKKRVLSEEARNRIAQAQKRRWAKQRRESQQAKKES